MTLTELLMEQRSWYPRIDDMIFDFATRDLPDAGPPIATYHLGAAAVQFFRIVKRLIDPSSVVEIGFNLGHSACMMLEIMDDLSVLSIDINDHEVIRQAAGIVSSKYPGRFSLLIGDSRSPKVQANVAVRIKPDLVFIDGDHSAQGVENDILFALGLGAKAIAFDDVLPHFCPGAADMIHKYRLKILAATGNMALCAPMNNHYKEQPCQE